MLPQGGVSGWEAPSEGVAVVSDKETRALQAPAPTSANDDRRARRVLVERVPALVRAAKLGARRAWRHPEAILTE